jgi:hypothetical protein
MADATRSLNSITPAREDNDNNGIRMSKDFRLRRIILFSSSTPYQQDLIFNYDLRSG